MTTPLLTTKLLIPPLRAELVARPRLIERLNRGLKYRLTLVSAPAGYGKTTLLSAWANLSGQEENRFAWVSLDKSDNDPVIFWDYFTTTLGGLQAGVGQETSAILHSPQPPQIESVLTHLINELDAIPGDFVIVLDDYHVIESLPVHSAVSFLLEHMPPKMHLVIATREDPPLALARLRARGLVIEVRVADLRFLPDEASAFLNRLMGLDIAADDVAALETRTEGWIAGLQMAALSMQSQQDITKFIKAFTASNRYVMDYLVEEVFQRQPAGVQNFLMETCILDRLTASLCDFVTGRTDSRDMLVALERANLFIVPLDESRQWYRYEHLFADLLQHQLDMTSAARDISTLHSRASHWYEANGLSGEAIHHAIAAMDWERATSLICGASETLMKRGEVTTLVNWVRALPDEAIKARPDLCTDYSWALILTGQVDAAESFLGQAERAAGDNPVLLGNIVAMQAYISRVRGDDQRTIELSEKALSLLPRDNIDLLCIVTLNLGIARWHSGNVREAEQALVQANQAAQRAGNQYAALTALSILGTIQAARGNLHRGAELHREAIELAGQSPAGAAAHMFLGALMYEWNNLDEALIHTNEGIQLSQRSGNMEIQSGGYRMLARVRQALGDAAGAAEAVRTADKAAESASLPSLDRSRNAACDVQIALEQGNIAEASRRAEQITEDADASPFYPRLNLTRARLLLAQDDRRGAGKELENLYRSAVTADMQYAVVEILALRATAAATRSGALALLTEALTLAQPGGYVRTFIDKGEPMAELLREAAGQGIAIEYIAQLLAHFRRERQSRIKTGKPASGPDGETQPLAEPLSERETEVLRFLSAGLSNREIAKQLVVSVGTVKTHVHNIIGKLGVSGRTQAIVRARELGLV